jgi:hypothetical protein
MDEKRVYPRTKCKKLVYIKFVDSEGQIDRQVLGHILNISKGGVRILSPLPVETKYIMMSALDSSNKSFGIRGEIVHSAKNQSGGYLLGVKFMAPDASCIKFIKAVIRAYFFEKHQEIINV